MSLLWVKLFKNYFVSEYIFIVKLLLHESENDLDEQRRLLQILVPSMLNNIQVNECVDVLFSRKIITEEDKELIERIDKQLGPIAATREILRVVPNRNPRWSVGFADVLAQNGLSEIAQFFFMPTSNIDDVSLHEGMFVHFCIFSYMFYFH